MTKPPYRVLSMEEIRALTPNGFVVASTFSGAGGSSLGYRMAGYRVAWASEFLEVARETYRANASPDTVLDERDIRDVTPQQLLEAAGVDELDLLDGSPPCASFSAAGSRETHWGKVKTYSDTKQRTDDLFFEFARLVDGVKPRVFVAENVKGLVRGSSKGYFKLILGALRDCGYRVSARLIDASWLGVPQARERLIFVGVRDDLGLDPVFPKPLPYRYSIRDALADFPEDATHDPETGRDVRFVEYSIYPHWRELKLGQSHPKRFNLIKSDPAKPSPTILATSDVCDAATAHWRYPRKFTLQELRRLCGFPDDFILTGDYPRRAERLGRAVPPVMMMHIAATIRDHILQPALARAA